MKERARLMAAFAGKINEKHAWYGDLSYWYGALKEDDRLHPRYMGDEGYLRFHQDMGVGICFYAPMLWETTYKEGVAYNESQSGRSRLKEYVTPVGKLRSVETYVPETYTWAITEHFVKDMEDLKVYAYICEHSKHAPQYDEYARIDRLWGEDGIAVGIAPMGSCPLQRMVARVAGVQSTYDIYAEDPDDFEDMLGMIAECERPIFQILAEAPTQLVEFPENLSADITGRNFFEQYNMPFYQDRTALLRAAGKYTSIHNDGMLLATWDLIGKSGFDAVEAVTPMPVGDMDVCDLREKAGEQIVIWGGVPGALFSGVYSDAYFEEYVRKLAATFRHDARFVFGVADQVPPDGLEHRVKLVREIVEAM